MLLWPDSVALADAPRFPGSDQVQEPRNSAPPVSRRARGRQPARLLLWWYRCQALLVLLAFAVHDGRPHLQLFRQPLDEHLVLLLERSLITPDDYENWCAQRLLL